MAPSVNTTRRRRRGAWQLKISIPAAYLFCYNLASLVGWLILLGRIIGVVIDAAAGVGGGSLLWKILSNTITHLMILQTIAVVEILHASVGLVRSAVIPTALQIFTRCTVIHLMRMAYAAGLLNATTTTKTSTGTSINLNLLAYTVMAMAWAIADSSRYLYYLVAAGPASAHSRITWFRYSQFLLLYPIGAGGEAMLLWACSGWPLFRPYCLALRLLVWVYPFGLAFMYRHMLRQRRRLKWH